MNAGHPTPIARPTGKVERSAADPSRILCRAKDDDRFRGQKAIERPHRAMPPVRVGQTDIMNI
jgi:hypothetical protein